MKKHQIIMDGNGSAARQEAECETSNFTELVSAAGKKKTGEVFVPEGTSFINHLYEQMESERTENKNDQVFYDQ